MKSISAITKKTSDASTSRIKVNFAKNIIFSRLQKINVGYLTVEYEGESISFGEASARNTLHAHVFIKDEALYPRILFGGTTGVGESYMLGHWTTPDLVKVIRLFAANQHAMNNMESSLSRFRNALNQVSGYFNRNTKRGSARNIAAHYDLSNTFFSLFLDSTMMYSSAIFPNKNETLEVASYLKLDHICRRLNLSANDSLLEIGTGWGGMAIHAAKHYGCQVTTTTISQEQYDYTCEKVKALELQDKITVLKKDYRDLSGKYDKIVSIEMIEAVGHEYYESYFKQCANLLKRDGLMLIQAITAQDQRFEQQKDRIDFIRRYIFPGGCLPSNSVITQCVATFTDMQLVGLEDITLDYAKTLEHWKQRFFNKIDEVKQLGFDDTFIRMWDFYLSYCEGGFRERIIGTSQFLFAKPACKDLPIIG